MITAPGLLTFARFFPDDAQNWKLSAPRIGVDLGVGEEFSTSLAMKITNSDGCRVAEVIDGEEALVAACNHPNCYVEAIGER